MGDPRAGSTGTTGTGAPALAPPSAASAPRGKRVARHAAAQRTSQPYAGRRVAEVVPVPLEVVTCAEGLPYAGRRVVGRDPIAVPVAPAVPVGRRIALIPEPQGDAEDVAGHLLRPTAVPGLETYVGRRIAQPVELITEPTVVKPARGVQRVAEESLAVPPAVEPPAELSAPVLDEPAAVGVILAEPILAEPILAEPILAEPMLAEPILAEPMLAEPILAEPILAEPAVVDAAELVDPVLAAHPELRVDVPTAPPATRVAPPQRRPGGRRVASRRSRIPSLPLLAGVAVLAVSAGGALQAVHPGIADAAADRHLSPASALSGSSAVGSASLLGGRGTVVSRDSDRQGLSSTSGERLRAAADQQAKQRDAALSAFAAQAEKQASKIKLHQWVLPVASGDYHLTARFGDYSSLWSHFHTGLDFAGPTGTPILAVAGGTVTEISYSGAYGNRTIETLPDGTELWYCHQNSFGTSVGATLKPGQLMGYIGSTGNVTGPHLHLEVHPGGGDPVDPYTALIVHGLQP
jgi:murein DD-endopeptidase MepM/ murein hydrolase activator NlpD